MTDLDLTVPEATIEASWALLRDPFYIVRPQTETISGVTSPTTPATLGPYAGEFWEAGGDELAPAITEARGRYRLAFPKSGVTVLETDQVLIGTRTYDVAWSPEPSGLDLQRVIGLKD